MLFRRCTSSVNGLWPADLSYGTSFTAIFRQVGIYSGRILNVNNPRLATMRWQLVGCRSREQDLLLRCQNSWNGISWQKRDWSRVSEWITAHPTDTRLFRMGVKEPFLPRRDRPFGYSAASFSSLARCTTKPVRDDSSSTFWRRHSLRVRLTLSRATPAMAARSLCVTL